MTLTIQDLGALGELLGSVALLVTLVYLTLQTRQNTTAIRAQLDSARIGAIQEVLLTAASMESWWEIAKPTYLPEFVDGSRSNARRRREGGGHSPNTRRWVKGPREPTHYSRARPNLWRHLRGNRTDANCVMSRRTLLVRFRRPAEKLCKVADNDRIVGGCPAAQFIANADRHFGCGGIGER